MMIWNQVEASWSKEMQTRELMLLMTCNLMQHILERVEMMTYNLKLLTLVKGIQTRMFLMTCNPVELTLAKVEMMICSHKQHTLVKEMQTKIFLMICSLVEHTSVKEEMTICSHRLHILVKVEAMIWNQTELICKEEMLIIKMVMVQKAKKWLEKIKRMNQMQLYHQIVEWVLMKMLKFQEIKPFLIKHEFEL